MYYEILVGSNRYHGNKPLAYVHDSALRPGCLVKIPLANRPTLGIILRKVDKPEFKVKEIMSAWEDIIIPATSLSLINWLHDYYPASLGSIVELFTPPNMLNVLKAPADKDIVHGSPEDLPSLTQEQNDALRQIKLNYPKSILLHGDTGTGKTRLYIELSMKLIEKGKSVIIMTPEIGLTEPLTQEFKQTFGDLVKITHSSLTVANRRELWIDVATTKEPVILIGPRSALFYPVNNLGMIILDEAHDTSYKQDSAPYYQTSRVAAQLCKIAQAQLIMGTATPLVADYYSFSEKNLPIIRLKSLAIKSDTKVQNTLIDSKDRKLFSRSANLSDYLLKSISEAIQNKEQSLLFLNRRGSARSILCSECGWQAQCPKCDSFLALHEDTHDLRCHSCDNRSLVPVACPSCQNPNIVFKSIGTKALEKEISKKFPQATIARFDSDTHKSQNISSRFKELESGSVDIIIGTQSIAKGFDLPKLSVVGVVQADSGLYMPDYTSEEKTYQLITQVTGRIGRGHRDGKLIIQSFNPSNPIFGQALQKNYAAFYESQIKERMLFDFPPHVYLMTVSCSRSSSGLSEKACLKIKENIASNVKGLNIEGPTPRFVERTNTKYTWQIILKSRSRQKLIESIKYIPSTCFYNLDPSTLL
jgi:primosomal protein N' (replication factor Y)